MANSRRHTCKYKDRKDVNGFSNLKRMTFAVFLELAITYRVKTIQKIRYFQNN